MQALLNLVTQLKIKFMGDIEKYICEERGLYYDNNIFVEVEKNLE